MELGKISQHKDLKRSTRKKEKRKNYMRAMRGNLKTNKNLTGAQGGKETPKKGQRGKKGIGNIPLKRLKQPDKIERISNKSSNRLPPPSLLTNRPTDLSTVKDVINANL